MARARRRALLAALAVAAVTALGAGPGANVLEIPDGSGGIGFDDLRYAPALGRMLVPAGRVGRVLLVDPASRSMKAIEGFTVKKEASGGHDDSVTSADEGKGWVFATDRTSMMVQVADPQAGRIVSGAKLASSPDYVRFVEATGEVWVTEPGKERIEIFRVGDGNPPALSHEAFVPVPGGPESLVVDSKSVRAYTHLWNGKTVVLDVKKRSQTASWPNGCRGSRGIALDPARGHLFAGCAEGKAVVLDAATGKELSSLSAGNGVDIIDFDPKASHLYLPGGKSATMAILAVSAEGKLSLLGQVDTAEGSHCVATDGNRNVFVCDPKRGRLLLFHDAFP